MYPSPDLMSGRERSMQGACWTWQWAMINLVYVCVCVCVYAGKRRKEETREQGLCGHFILTVVVIRGLSDACFETTF